MHSRISLGRRCGSGADFFSGELHFFFEAFSGMLPGMLHEGDVTAPFPLAGIFAGVAAAAPLAFAGILPDAGMLDRSAGSLAGAGVVFAGSLAFAHIEPATDVRLLEQQARLLGGGRCFLRDPRLLRPGIGLGILPAAGKSGSHSSQRGGGEPVKIATIQFLFVHHFLLNTKPKSPLRRYRPAKGCASRQPWVSAGNPAATNDLSRTTEPIDSGADDSSGVARAFADGVQALDAGCFAGVAVAVHAQR